MKRIPKKKQHELEVKSEKLYASRCPEGVKGCGLYSPTTRAITTSEDVVIIEKTNYI